MPLQAAKLKLPGQLPWSTLPERMFRPERDSWRLLVAEVHSSAVDIEGEPSIIGTDGQRSAVVLDPMVAPRKDGGLRKEMSVLEPLEHSVLGLSLEGGDACGDKVVELHPLEHSGVDCVDRPADLTGGRRFWNR